MRQIHLPNPGYFFLGGQFKKPAFYFVLALLLTVFGNVLLPLLGHMVILCLEVLELLFENFLEAVFGIELHDVQRITAWTGFIVFSILLIELAKRITVIAQRVKSKLLQSNGKSVSK